MNDRGSARRGVIAGGNWIIDQVKLIDGWPAQDALASIVEEETGNGGAPYNVLKNLARLGAAFPLEAVGLLGADQHGAAILADCRSHGIATEQLRTVAGAATSYTDVMTVKATGRRTFFHRRGVNARLDVGDFNFGRTRARWLHLGYLLLLDRLDQLSSAGLPRVVDVLQAARRHGLLTSVDVVSEHADRFRQVVLPVLPHVDILFLNDYEAERLTGQSLRPAGRLDRAAVSEAAGQLASAGVRQWVVLHAPEGVLARAAGGAAVWQPAVRVPPESVAGAAGAGDALASGVLYGVHEGWPIERALELGVCVAAASLAHPSCSGGVRPLAECLELGRTLGWQR